MPEHSETIVLSCHREAVWQALAQPEAWFAGYKETRSRSSDYPASGTRNDHVYHTRVDENVDVVVVRSEPAVLLEEEHEGKTFRRRVSYRLEESTGEGTTLSIVDDIGFKGLARLATPFAFDDAKRRWRGSLERLRSIAEAGGAELS